MTEDEKTLLIQDAVDDYFLDINKYLGIDYDLDDTDIMTGDAIKLIKHYDFVSISMLIRILRIGETRAVRLFYLIKENGMLSDVKNSFFHYHKSEINKNIDIDQRNKKSNF